ncbi:MAG: peptidoglycan editing factor PgeF [Gammaproteobacteria bacterium]|nr:peptidoglycan editing factor PgeF [Gammaproteobacteria bacterium]MDP2141896.1 peptidoglycan editing factor PgeF [Gammaproteobacteria bacterium]MDP2347222.1 peptidoglycan editing factor PgeF [Gammaproteobacteria bacterium]
MATVTAPTVSPILICPEWPVPASVIALVTTRGGGVSKAPFNTFNLALHVNDEPADVLANRAILQEHLEQDLDLQWLQQVHGTEVVQAGRNAGEKRGDAVFIDQPGVAGVVMTADCLPVFFAALDGSSVAVAHAGWRGLADGILERTLETFSVSPAEIICWMGPAIGPCHFEVGVEVRDVFLNACVDDTQRREMLRVAFRLSSESGKFHADLYSLARLRLQQCGVVGIHGGGFCTHCDAERFFSYRREQDTGRMASVIGLKKFS